MVKLGGLLKQSFLSFYQTCQFSNEPAISNLTSGELKTWQKKPLEKEVWPITELPLNQHQRCQSGERTA